MKKNDKEPDIVRIGMELGKVAADLPHVAEPIASKPKAESAYNDLLEYLEPEEKVEALVFGYFGWDGYNEGADPIGEKRGTVLTLAEAEPMMQGWSFYGGYGAPECYAVYVWTNQRVIWVTQYDGSTRLSSAPRNPVACKPDMPGG